MKKGLQCKGKKSPMDGYVKEEEVTPSNVGDATR